MNANCVWFGFGKVDDGYGFGNGPEEPGFGLVQVGVGYVDSFVGFVYDSWDGFGLEIAVGVEGGSGLDGVGDNAAVDFVEGLVAFVLDKVDGEIDVDEVGAGVGESEFDLERVVLGFDNDAVGFVDKFCGHGHLDFHGGSVGIVHLVRVSLLHSSPLH